MILKSVIIDRKWSSRVIMWFPLLLLTSRTISISILPITVMGSV